MVDSILSLDSNSNGGNVQAENQKELEKQKVENTRDFVFVKSRKMPESTGIVKGFEFNKQDKATAVAGNIANDSLVDYSALFSCYKQMGFQATNLGQAIDIVNEMLYSRSPDSSIPGDEGIPPCKIFLGYTSNLVSSGLRDMMRYLVQRKLVHVVVASAGGIEEDFIKCLGPTYVGAFDLDGASLRKKGINRIGNLLVPNDNYCLFEDWVVPILDQLLHEQKTENIVWTPSMIIRRLGKEINHPESIYYWAYKNDIPIYCPALTDGSLGDMIYFHSFKNPGLIVDIAEQAVFAPRTGMLILGGGVIKHHICNANLMRNGSDYAVYINTGLEFDGSDAGARCDEAVSWGKIREGAKSVKVHADATLVVPILIAETFAKVPFNPA